MKTVITSGPYLKLTSDSPSKLSNICTAELKWLKPVWDYGNYSATSLQQPPMEQHKNGCYREVITIERSNIYWKCTLEILKTGCVV